MDSEKILDMSSNSQRIHYKLPFTLSSEVTHARTQSLGLRNAISTCTVYVQLMAAQMHIVSACAK